MDCDLELLSLRFAGACLNDLDLQDVPLDDDKTDYSMRDGLSSIDIAYIWGRRFVIYYDANGEAMVLTWTFEGDVADEATKTQKDVVGRILRWFLPEEHFGACDGEINIVTGEVSYDTTCWHPLVI